MKRILFILVTCLLSMSCVSCSSDDPLWDENATAPSPSEQPEAGGNDEGNGNNGSEHDNNGDNNDENEDNGNMNGQMNQNILIHVGGHTFSATLEDNETARAFLALLPMTVNMTEMNGNEKYYNLSQNLPTHTFRPGTIHAGDLLLWGSNTVVLFYETFSSGYSYTRLGKIDNPEGLASAVGRGNVSVTFAVQSTD